MSKPKIYVHGSYVGNTGYNNHTRDFFRELSKYCQIKVRNFTVGDSWDGYNENCHDGEKDITELDKEHVTSHMKRNPNKYRSHYIETPQQLSWPELSLSLDEATDYEVLSSIINEIEPKDPLFGTNRIIEFFNIHEIKFWQLKSKTKIH
jgi:spore coat polysaccharide biosynthesis protein SpsF (cytidylyltransferase family)